MSTAPADRTTHPSTTGNRHAPEDKTEPPAQPTLVPTFPAPMQVRLPIRADGKRGSDRIRFRIWQDPRLSGLVQTVVLVISEFVDQAHAARLKGQTIAECAHMSVERCLKAANVAASLGVMAIDRRSHHRRYVFLDSWLRWFGNPAERPERHDVSSSHDTTIRRVTGEPVQKNLLKPIAAAKPPAHAREADRRQQQQQNRLKGLFGAIAARCRELGHDYDEQDERRRLREGEIDIDRLQRHADDLATDVRERRLRRAHGPR